MTATKEILAALDKTIGSASSKDFVASVCEGEGGVSWRTLYAGGTLLPPTDHVQSTPAGRIWTGSLATFPTWGGAELSPGFRTTAAGAGQFLKPTYQDIARITGRSGFEDQDQIQNIWALADQVFSAHAGLSLHAALEAHDLELIPKHLATTWPGGCDGGFPQRFINNLPLVQTTVTALSGHPAHLP